VQYQKFGKKKKKKKHCEFLLPTLVPNLGRWVGKELVFSWHSVA
jgi:hypothetical protein